MRLVGNKHYIIDAMRNCAAALGMAMEVWSNGKTVDREGVQELVTVINVAAIQLKGLCQRIVNNHD